MTNNLKGKDFYHGTSWEAAKQIEKEGMKRGKPWFNGESYIWLTLAHPQAAEYGKQISGNQHEGDESKYAVVHVKWPLDKTEADPEYDETDESLAQYDEVASFRRTPYDIPRTAIVALEFYDNDKIDNESDK
jgi:hypothetical protein